MVSAVAAACTVLLVGDSTRALSGIGLQNKIDVALESWTLGRFARSVRALALAAAASILVVSPLAKPLLSQDAYVRHAATLGLRPGTNENHRLGRLPQFFPDMHGWRELAEAVAAANAALPAEDRARACVYGRNYGEAAAIEYFGPALGLPKAISRHNSYWMWGPGSCTGAVVLIIGGERTDHVEDFESVDPAEAWNAEKHYD